MIILISCFSYAQRSVTDFNYYQQIEKDFNVRKSLIFNQYSGLNDAFISTLSSKEKDALQFLYAYMPLNDIADHDAGFYLKNIKSSLEAQQYFSWGKNIPGNLFLHFVLPIRVNNEFLDSSRWVFFNELKDRVKLLSMEQAILEVNHWCHEKVCYKGSDGRTSSPLCTIRTSFGRCGEESVFTVAALRAVGIPARQCYTPRWAHCDDNHAWVEVWVEGKWHYIGACEPDVALDKAWFTAPAKRAMQVNTNVFGKYQGDEEVLFKGKYHTRINLIQQYTETKNIVVKVMNEKNKPIDSAQVLFCLYNYAEFYPLAKKFTDIHGVCDLKTGLGDIVLWISYKGKFNYAKVSSSMKDTLVIIPSKTFSSLSYNEMDLVPPPELPINETNSADLAKINDNRLHYEDSLRTNYMSTFPDSGAVSDFATGLKVNFETLMNIISESKGNWKEIIKFLSWVPENRMKDAIGLLKNITEKDVRDCPSDILKDHLLNFQFNPAYSEEINYQYILSPRISTEQLTAFRSYLIKLLGEAFKQDAQKNIQFIIKRINQDIQIDNEANYYNIPITPIGVMQVRAADKTSRNILFVAICRAMGIPARLETATLKPQYYHDNTWVDVYSETAELQVSPKGKLKVMSDANNSVIPQYSTHYTFAKLGNANLQTLDYEENPTVVNFPYTLDLDTGSYVLITGTRLKNGSVLSSVQPFSIRKDKLTELNITLRKPILSAQVLGSIDMKQSISLEEKTNTNLASLHWGVNIIAAWVTPDAEPTKHLFAELQQFEKQLNSANIPVVLFVQNDKEVAALKAVLQSYHLPKNIFVGKDDQLNLMKSIKLNEATSITTEFPVISVIKPQGEMIFYSKGYQIGSVDRMMQVLK